MAPGICALKSLLDFITVIKISYAPFHRMSKQTFSVSSPNPIYPKSCQQQTGRRRCCHWSSPTGESSSRPNRPVCSIAMWISSTVQIHRKQSGMQLLFSFRQLLISLNILLPVCVPIDKCERPYDDVLQTSYGLGYCLRAHCHTFF